LTQELITNRVNKKSKNTPELPGIIRISRQIGLFLSD